MDQDAISTFSLKVLLGIFPKTSFTSFGHLFLGDSTPSTSKQVFHPQWKFFMVCNDNPVQKTLVGARHP